MRLRFYHDPASGAPHIERHHVTPAEVREILENPGAILPGHDGARLALGATDSGRHLVVVFVPDPEPASMFVVTAYELRGKALAAYRRRRRGKS